MLDLDELAESAQTLEPLPASATRLASALSSSDVDLSEIASIVAYDEALTLRLLKAANSAVSGGATRITRAQDAMFRLGSARVLALTVAASARALLKRNVSVYGLCEGELWEHSVATAAAAEVIPEFSHADLPIETFTAALLHDVGKLVMGRFLSDEDLDWIQQAQQKGGLTALEAERQILDVHHGELGGLVAQRWQLPERIVKGIIYHHDPSSGGDIICDAVYCANLLAKSAGGGPPEPLDPACLERLGIRPEYVGEIAEAARSRFQAVKARYNA